MPLSVLQWASLHQLSRFLLFRAVPLSRECHRPCRVPTKGVCTRRTGGATCKLCQNFQLGTCNSVKEGT
eukprot:68273-Amphidinium_carterae.1